MALTQTEVDVQMTALGKRSVDALAARDRAISNLIAAENSLNAIAGDFSELATTVNGYIPTGDWETYKKSQFAEYVDAVTSLQPAIAGDNTHFAANPYPPVV